MSLLVYPIAKRALFPLIRLFLKEIGGIENIPKNGPFIVTSNHESYLDPLLIASVIIPIRNAKVYFLANKGRFWNVFGYKISKGWAGCIPLDDGKEKALEELLDLLNKGSIAGMFIEGPRSMDGSLRKGKTGVVRLALKAKVPVLPIGLVGTFDIAPNNKILPKLKRAKMLIGTPIAFNEHYGSKPTERLIRKLTGKVMLSISALTNKPYPY